MSSDLDKGGEAASPVAGAEGPARLNRALQDLNGTLKEIGDLLLPFDEVRELRGISIQIGKWVVRRSDDDVI